MRATLGRGNQTLRLDGRLREIVDESARLFDLHGYATVTMDDIAQAVGLRKPTLYHYVRSKQAILVLIHREFMDLITAQLELPERVALSPSAQLRAIIGDIIGMIHTHKGHVRVFFEHQRELPARTRKQITRERDSYAAAVGRVIEAGVKAKDFRGVDPQIASLALFGMCNWAYQWYNPRGRLGPEEIAATLADYLIQGIRTRR